MEKHDQLKEQREVYATSFCFERNLEGANGGFLHKKEEDRFKILAEDGFHFTHPSCFTNQCWKSNKKWKNEKNETGIADV